MNFYPAMKVQSLPGPPRYAANEFEVLVRAGKAIHTPPKLMFSFFLARYTLTLRVKCLRCPNRQYYRFSLDNTPVPKPEIYDRDCMPYLQVWGGGEATYLPLLCAGCARHDRTRFYSHTLAQMHAAAKAVLQTLPQPIFEEVWNHVGWDPLIK